MGTAGAARLRCPDCAKAVGPLEGEPVCPGCGRPFAPADGVWDLLPRALDSMKINEDRTHRDEGLSTWRRLFLHKRYWLEWCEDRWLPELVGPPTRRVLEIGGGLCYASALAKGRAPQAWVAATDISARYLRHHARRVGEILEHPADAYAAVDAEALPFEDEQFDAVYSQVVLYRLPDPVRALREIRRVLAPGGRYLGIERASPWLPPFSGRERRILEGRARECGIGERPVSFRGWQAVLAQAGLEPRSVTPIPGRRLRGPWLRRLGNAVRPVHVAIRLSR